MKKIFVVLAVFISVFAYSQDCNYKTNEIDEFTKNKILETKSLVLTISGMGFGFSTSCSLKKINNNRYLKLGVVSPSIFSLKSGDNIMFKTESAETINLQFTETIIADYNSATKYTPSTWSGTTLMPISDINYERLKTEKTLKLRIYTRDGYVDDDISNRRSKLLIELLNCIE